MPGLGLGPISSAAISSIPDFTVSLVTGELRIIYSMELDVRAIATDTDSKIYACTEEYITRSTDTPSGTPLPGILEHLPRFDRSIISGDGFGGLSNSWGNAGLINIGDYDQYLRGYAFDGRRAVFKALLRAHPYAFAQTIANLTATSVDIDGQMIVFGFRDNSFKLDVPTQPNVYAGTGGVEGGPELTGKRRNMALGSPRDFTPVLLISSELVLEVNGGRPVQAITAVYDKGYPLDGPEADYANLTLLRAAAITDGWFSTCLAEGRFRTGSAYEQITCNVQGDNSGGYVTSTGRIMRRIISINGCISDPAEVDTVAFANLELPVASGGNPAPVEYYLDENSTETVAESFAKLMHGIGGWCGFTRLGLLQAGIFTAPSGTQTGGEYTELEIIDIDVETLPSGLDPPPWRQQVIYERNCTIISDPFAGVGDIDPARAAWLRTPYKVASTTQADGDVILADRLMAQDPPVREAYFALGADALAEANRSLTLANSNYVLYRIRLKAAPFNLDIGQTIRVTLTRFGLNSGRLLRVVSISDIPDDGTIEVRALG
jgi:hypothetical protein